MYNISAWSAALQTNPSLPGVRLYSINREPSCVGFYSVVKADNMSTDGTNKRSRLVIINGLTAQFNASRPLIGTGDVAIHCRSVGTVVLPEVNVKSFQITTGWHWEWRYVYRRLYRFGNHNVLWRRSYWLKLNNRTNRAIVIAKLKEDVPKQLLRDGYCNAPWQARVSSGDTTCLIVESVSPVFRLLNK